MFGEFSKATSVSLVKCRPHFFEKKVASHNFMTEKLKKFFVETYNEMKVRQCLVVVYDKMFYFGTVLSNVLISNWRNLFDNENILS